MRIHSWKLLFRGCIILDIITYSKSRITFLFSRITILFIIMIRITLLIFKITILAILFINFHDSFWSYIFTSGIFRNRIVVWFSSRFAKIIFPNTSLRATFHRKVIFYICTTTSIKIVVIIAEAF